MVCQLVMNSRWATNSAYDEPRILNAQVLSAGASTGFALHYEMPESHSGHAYAYCDWVTKDGRTKAPVRHGRSLRTPTDFFEDVMIALMETQAPELRNDVTLLFDPSIEDYILWWSPTGFVSPIALETGEPIRSAASRVELAQVEIGLLECAPEWLEIASSDPVTLRGLEVDLVDGACKATATFATQSSPGNLRSVTTAGVLVPPPFMSNSRVVRGLIMQLTAHVQGAIG